MVNFYEYLLVYYGPLTSIKTAQLYTYIIKIH